MTELVPDLMDEQPLSKVEDKRLEELEGVIEKNFKGFVAVGAALAEIRERRLYRIQFKTFEEYCQNLWDMSHQRASQLIASKQVVDNLATMVAKNGDEDLGTIVPKNERQARELAKIPPEEQIAVWQQLLEDNRDNYSKITAKSIKKAVHSFLGSAIDNHVEKAAKETRENRTDFQSEAFTEAFNTFFDQVRIEKESNWRKTSRKTVFRILRGLLDVVSEAVPGTLEIAGCALELSDREKLKKGGYRIFRMDVKHSVIEEWQHDDSWMLFIECGSPKALHDRFAALMEGPSHLKG